MRSTVPPSISFENVYLDAGQHEQPPANASVAQRSRHRRPWLAVSFTPLHEVQEVEENLKDHAHSHDIQDGLKDRTRETAEDA